MTTRFLGFLFLTSVALSFSTGCATTPPPASPKSDVAWVTRELSPGVEIRIRKDASPGAREAAERLQDDYRSTYLNAR